MIPADVRRVLRKMRGFRNILMPEYGHVNGRVVYEMVTPGLASFDLFRDTVLRFCILRRLFLGLVRSTLPNIREGVILRCV
ncbi:MAG: HepT-like ribonuclease domain-containing protein [Candidatus Caldatribacteriaceae bacterium]